MFRISKLQKSFWRLRSGRRAFLIIHYVDLWVTLVEKYFFGWWINQVIGFSRLISGKLSTKPAHQILYVPWRQSDPASYVTDREIIGGPVVTLVRCHLEPSHGFSVISFDSGTWNRNSLSRVPTVQNAPNRLYIAATAPASKLGIFDLQRSGQQIISVITGLWEGHFVANKRLRYRPGR